MAAFRVHEDRENGNAFAHKKEDAENVAQGQRRALGDLNPFSCALNRGARVHSNVANIMKKDENKPSKPLLKEKNIVPPVAQFEAFSVYEDKAEENANANRKRENTFKPFSSTNFKSGQTEKVKPKEQIENAKIQPKAQDENAKDDVLPKIDGQNKAQAEKPVTARIPFQEKYRDASFESPMSVAQDDCLLSMSLAQDKSVLTEEDEANKTVAETDRDMFFHVAEYRSQIYGYMREIEMKHRPNPRYMRKQPDINYTMRAVLVDWLSEVCEEYGQQAETLHLAVSYVDRFLSVMSVVRGKLQLVGTAATFIAAKYEEVYPPEVRDFVYITDDTYNKREVLRMEHLILKVLSFDLSTPTVLSFLSLFCITHQLPKKTKHLAQYIADLSLLEGEPYLQYKASIIAAGCLATARHCLYCKRCNDEDKPVQLEDQPHKDCLDVAWPEALQSTTGYDIPAIKVALAHLSRTHATAHSQSHRAIYDKYRNVKFDAVALIEARPLYPVQVSSQSTTCTPQAQRTLSVS